MMYVSVYPVAISMRNSNIYEERSLGIFAQPDDLEDAVSTVGNDRLSRKGSIATFLRRPNQNTSRAFFVRQQVRAQLADDAYWIVLAVFVIMIIEGSQFERDPINFSVFNVIFEVVVSAGGDPSRIGQPTNHIGGDSQDMVPSASPLASPTTTIHFVATGMH
jgi:Trk-type K+ transport system membrane component